MLRNLGAKDGPERRALLHANIEKKTPHLHPKDLFSHILNVLAVCRYIHVDFESTETTILLEATRKGMVRSYIKNGENRFKP